MRQRIICGVLIALAISGCQKKASGQTVAVVNNQEITAAELNSELTNDNNLATGNTQQARQAALQRIIDRALLVQQAKSDGVDKSPEYLTQLRRATDDLLINMMVSRKLNTAQVPSQDEINRYEASRPEMFSGREIWTLNQVVYPQPKDPAIQAKLNAANTLDDVAQVLTSAGIQFTRSTRKIDTAAFPHEIYAQVAKLQAGGVFIAPGPGKAVANVITTRQPNPTPEDQAKALAVSAMRRDQVNKIVGDQVKRLRTSAKIEYQPGYAPASK